MAKGKKRACRFGKLKNPVGRRRCKKAPKKAAHKKSAHKKSAKAKKAKGSGSKIFSTKTVKAKADKCPRILVGCRADGKICKVKVGSGQVRAMTGARAATAVSTFKRMFTTTRCKPFVSSVDISKVS